jgi:hypothetical protein
MRRAVRCRAGGAALDLIVRGADRRPDGAFTRSGLTALSRDLIALGESLRE